MERKGEMGVGTLIIFIALLLVAAVAAGVLIQTAGSLQQRALTTGSQATGQISTNALVLEVSGIDGQDGNLENFTIIAKLAPGSDPIKLGDVTFTYATTNDTITYGYRAPLNATTGDYCALNATENYTDHDKCGQVAGGQGNFTVDYLQTGQNHQNGVLVRGDVIDMHVPILEPVVESQSVRFNFVPKIGTTTQIIFDTPDVMSTQRVYLYP